MSSAVGGPRVGILLGGGVREALMAQPVIRACEGATVYASADALGSLMGLPFVGRKIIFEDSPLDQARLFWRLRSGALTTIVVPYPAHFAHAALAYFSGIPRRLIFPGHSDWAASERISGADGLHPIEGNWRLALAAAHRPMRAMSEVPQLQPAETVRQQIRNRFSSFLGGHRPLVLIPGGGGWSKARPGPIWPAERFGVVANQSMAERVLILRGVGDQRAASETRADIVKPAQVVDITTLTVEEVAALSELSSAVVGHAGDALHVAAAVDALVLAIGRRPDIPPLGERVVTCWVDDYDRYPARRVIETLSGQARVDTYA
jgi:ADP-heptose:LPS heptosyltransferase